MVPTRWPFATTCPVGRCSARSTCTALYEADPFWPTQCPLHLYRPYNLAPLACVTGDPYAFALLGQSNGSAFGLLGQPYDSAVALLGQSNGSAFALLEQSNGSAFPLWGQ